MAHDVTITLPERKLGKADVTFSVKRDGYMLGTLLVSKGLSCGFPADTNLGTRCRGQHLTW